ncbi:MAG: hypothetical protein H6621_09850 [Halobacteriovoraceae bacterium]|nr:hypothetical protein [Halobacteriovoraceae bacterium]MCB9095360.1 hypothetical protein [Halobacteriovoraceae bacterium]
MKNKIFLLSLLILTHNLFANSCPDLTGDWKCSENFMRSMLSPNTFPWPSRDDAKMSGWKIEEANRDATSVTYLFSGQEVRAKIQDQGVLPDQTAELKKEGLSYCSPMGTLIMVSVSERSEIYRGEEVIATNFSIGRTEFMRIDEKTLLVVRSDVSSHPYMENHFARETCTKE